ncbi:MAG: acyl-CoA dehydrogenase family protein [Solirubrobacteraceae bacterium]|jgi:acyl-CoA dehydrogenase
MVDFTLTDEQLALRELAHDFAAREIRPAAAALDRDATFPTQLIRRAWELGLMNGYVPERYGGVGLSALEGVLVDEELAWGCSGVATSIGANALATVALLIAGSEDLQRTYLGRLVAEPRLASFCLTEPDAGSDVAAIRTRATRFKDRYVISGSKCFITNGGHADFYVVFAKTEPELGARGISCFVVPRTAGVVVERHEDKLGQRASDTASVSFPDVEVTLDHLVGDENTGFKIAMSVLDRMRPGVAAIAIGIARAAFEHACAYAKDRTQFGVPLATHQAIQMMIADMATEIEAARLLAWRAAVALDRGEPATLLSAHAKRFAADAAMRIATDAVQVYGGYGFIKDYPVEKLMRDAKLMQIYEGTSQIQRLVIAREVFAGR